MCTGASQSNGEYWCDSAPRYVDSANYDTAGRLYQMKFPAGGNLWRTQGYYAWTMAKNGGLLDEIKVGTTEGSSNRFYRKYTYNSFGDVLTDGSGYTFGYDSLGRLTSAYGKSYSYWPTNRFNSFEGKSYGYASFPYHAVNTVGGVDRYDYDANGNMTVRDKGLSTQQTLTWNGENRLVSVTGTGVNESYIYDADGNRIKKVSGGVTTYTWFPHYEKEGSTVVKYYSFNGMRVAIRKGTTLSYIHSDHLGSSSVETNSSGVESASRTYYAYGSTRSSSGILQTDRTFTGQKQDGTGLTANRRNTRIVGLVARSIRVLLPFAVSSSSVETNSSGVESASRTDYVGVYPEPVEGEVLAAAAVRCRPTAPFDGLRASPTPARNRTGRGWPSPPPTC